MTHPPPGHGSDSGQVDDVPVRVAAVMARLLHTLPPPADAHDPDILTGWLSDRADLCDRISTACADPGLAGDARAIAAAARRTLAALGVPPLIPVGAPDHAEGGAG